MPLMVFVILGIVQLKMIQHARIMGEREGRRLTLNLTALGDEDDRVVVCAILGARG